MNENLREAEQAIRTLQEHARELGQRFDSRSLEERALFLVTEVGEVVTELLVLNGAKTRSAADGVVASPYQVRERLGLELYDVLWNLCDLANRAGVDLRTALRTKAEINRKRIWQE